jgi:ATP-dependent protease ClpP protease subunit
MAMQEEQQQQIENIDIISLGGIRCVGNRILFYADIATQSALELNRLLREMDIKLQDIKKFSDDFSPVCHLHLQSNGGEISPAFSIIDTIRTMKTPVHTHVEGLVASAGTLISTVGQKKYMTKYSYMLIHQLRAETYGKYEDLADNMINNSSYMSMMRSYYKEYTKIPVKKLDELLKRELYLTAKECLELGLIDEIL